MWFLCILQLRLSSSLSMEVPAPLPLVCSLQENYTEDSLTWDFMAKREMEAPGAGEELQTAKGRASDINRREERCCQVYEEGVKSLNTGRSSHIHRRAIDLVMWAVFPKDKITRWLKALVWIVRMNILLHIYFTFFINSLLKVSFAHIGNNISIVLFELSQIHATKSDLGGLKSLNTS